jgi:hypothetical protein
MMHSAKHISWQKRAIICFLPRKRRPEPGHVKKSELIVNFGKAENAHFNQF